MRNSNIRNSNRRDSKSNMIPRLVGCVVLLAFMIFEQLWIVTLVGAAAFAVFFYLQVVVEKTRAWYASPYLYAIALCLVLAWLEYQNGLISNLLNL